MEADRKLTRLILAGAILVVTSGNWLANAQHVDSLTTAYNIVENWAKLPPGRSWGGVIGVEIDPDGKSVWVLDRCGLKGCMDPIGATIDPIQKFNRDGQLVASFGAGLFNWPHGFFVDRAGNVWASDGIGVNGKGSTVFKFSSDGKILMMLGKPGVAVSGEDTFASPTDVVVGRNGEIFVADGHGEKSARIVKFTKDGRFIKTWGREGSAAGELDVPHGLAIDRQGRLFVADRSNNRIQIFDQDGNFIDAWKQFGRPSGLYIDQNGALYVADSQSDERNNAPFGRGIRIGSARDGHVTAFIPDPSSPESVAVDDQGNVFGGFIEMRTLKKYVKN